jgi:hypothetical protein
MTRHGWKAGFVGVGLLLAFAAGLWAVELESTEPGGGEPGRRIPLPPPRPEPPVSENPLTRAVRGIEVGEPIWYKGLGVYPLFQRRVTDKRDYLSLDEALSRGDLVIREVGRGTVSKVSVRNTSDRYAFLLANEMLVGGMQNRMLREDLLLRPRSGEVIVEVFCVEQGRWHNPEMQFEHSEALSEQRMRKDVAGGARQEEVWRRVNEFSQEYEVSSPTGDLKALQSDEKVARELAEYERGILPKLPEETVGLVATRGPSILGADIFCNEALFHKLRRKLIQSYALTRMDEPTVAVVLGRREVEDFLRRAYRADYSEWEAPDVGRRLRVRGGGLVGAGISFEGSLVHAVLFPEREVEPLPEPEPMPRPLLPRRPSDLGE